MPGRTEAENTSAMTKLSFAVALLLISLPVSCAQDASVPEAAFLSIDRYTNAFLGFSLPLPPDPAFDIVEVSPSGMWHRLFGLEREKGHTLFVISAQQMMARDAERLMKIAAPTISLHGKEFSKGISRQKGPDGTIWKAMYLTVINNYLLQFDIQSLDPKIAEDLEHRVEETKFFEPAKARMIAGPNGKPYNPAPARHSKN